VIPIVIEGTYDGAVSGGFSLDFTTTDAQTKAVAIIFAGLTKAATGQCSFSDSAPSHENVGAAGDLFEPDLVIFRSTDSTLNVNTANGTLALGFATNTSPIQQVSSYVNWDELNDPTDSDGYIRSDAASSAFNGTTRTLMDRFAVTSFDSTGFNGQAADVTGAGDTALANYLALKFSGAVTLGAVNEAVSASTGAKSFTGLGFTPDLVFGMSTLLESIGSIIDGPTASAAGHFVTGVYGDRAYTVQNQEGLNIGGAVVTLAQTRQEDAAVLTYDHLGSVAQRASWNGGVSGGFSLSFSVADEPGHLTLMGIQLEQTPLVTSESVLISEGAVLLLIETLEPDAEAVEVSDQALLSEATAEVTGPDAVNRKRGHTALGGAEAGRTEGGGPAEGLTA
jgi:hypothetical protein